MFRRLQVFLVAALVVVAAFATGADFLFFLLYLGLLVVGGAYVVTRQGLTGLEAGYTVDRVHAEVGDNLRATYTVRNMSRLPKLWLELSNPTDLPVPLPGRALALGPGAERSWIARVPLPRRGRFRIQPLVVRTGDPFGFFEASAAVGTSSEVTVYPRVEPLPRWRLPAASIEGSQRSPERTLQTTPLVTSVRPYVPGDAYNRIHWKSSARQRELQVKEFDLEQTADMWIFLDLQRNVHAGAGIESTVEAAVRIAASVGGRALGENRAMGLTASSRHPATLPADRGARQQQKLMQLLAVVEGDGDRALVEVLLEGLARLRRGMTAVIVTPSLERTWIRPLTGLRTRGVGCVVCHLDAPAYDGRRRRETGAAPLASDALEEQNRARRAVHHALAEHDIESYEIVPDRALGDLLVARGVGQGVRR